MLEAQTGAFDNVLIETKKNNEISHKTNSKERKGNNVVREFKQCLGVLAKMVIRGSL